MMLLSNQEIAPRHEKTRIDNCRSDLPIATLPDCRSVSPDRDLLFDAWICTPQAVDSDPCGHPYDPHREASFRRPPPTIR